MLSGNSRTGVQFITSWSQYWPHVLFGDKTRLQYIVVEKQKNGKESYLQALRMKQTDTVNAHVSCVQTGMKSVSLTNDR